MKLFFYKTMAICASVATLTGAAHNNQTNAAPRVTAENTQAEPNNLLTAAEKGDIQTLKALIKAGADLTKRNKFHYTALHCAACYNQPEALRLLLQAGIPVDEHSANGTPLICATKHGNIECMKILLEAGAHTELICDFTPPLLCAVNTNNTEATKLLLEYGANPSAHLKPDGDSALHAAVRVNNLHILQMLLKSGANTQALNNDKLTPLQYAEELNHKEAADLISPPVKISALTLNLCLREAILANNAKLLSRLLAEGANPNAIIEDNMTALTFAIKHQKTFLAKMLLEAGADVQPSGCENPLVTAAQMDDTYCADLLIQAGADVNATGFYKSTPLYVAAYNDNGSMARFLLEKGARVVSRANNQIETALRATTNGDDTELVKLMLAQEGVVDTENNTGCDSLVTAVIANKQANVRALLAAGVDPNKGEVLSSALEYGHLHLVADMQKSGRLTSQVEYSPLHMAAACGSADELKQLAAQAQDLNQHDKYGFTPLHCAVLANNPAAVDFLIKAGADPNAVTENRQATALHLAAGINEELVTLLINGGADVDAHEKNGSTALHTAVWSNKTESVKALLKAGANPNAVDDDGFTVLHMAGAMHRTHLFPILLTAGADPEACLPDSEYSPLDVAEEGVDSDSNNERIIFLRQLLQSAYSLD